MSFFVGVKRYKLRAVFCHRPLWSISIWSIVSTRLTLLFFYLFSLHFKNVSKARSGWWIGSKDFFPFLLWHFRILQLGHILCSPSSPIHPSRIDVGNSFIWEYNLPFRFDRNALLISWMPRKGNATCRERNNIAVLINWAHQRGAREREKESNKIFRIPRTAAHRSKYSRLLNRIQCRFDFPEKTFPPTSSSNDPGSSRRKGKKKSWWGAHLFFFWRSVLYAPGRNGAPFVIVK